MKKAIKADKAIITDILSNSFDQDSGLNYLISQDSGRITRIRNLVEYCFEVTMLTGQAYISDNQKSCRITDKSGKGTWIASNG